MNEQIVEQLLPILEKTKEGILKGIEVAQEQCPELIRQLLTWKFYESLTGFMVNVVLGVGSALLIKHGISVGIAQDWSEESCPVFIPCLIVGAVVGLVSLTVLLASGIPGWVQILIAPKIYLLEYISSFMR